MRRYAVEHVPVLLDAVLAHLLPGGMNPGAWFVDGTTGAGGHAAALLEAAPEVRLLAMDQDADALALARVRLLPFERRVLFVQANFEEMASVAAHYQIPAVQGVLLDLGVSSMQLDRAERGFSFMRDGPLDMRMNGQGGETAAELIRTLDERELADVIFRYGEESASRRIARAIKAALAEGQALENTQALADVVAKASGGRTSRLHPATKTFQALRMAVNRELDVLENALPDALQLLAPGGRLAVISFHSLEDRMVKQFMNLHEGKMVSLPAGGARWSGALPRGRRVTKKPVVAEEAEVQANPRARSAKLRVLERMGENE